jgi:hypothetical protein
MNELNKPIFQDIDSITVDVEFDTKNFWFKRYPRSTFWQNILTVIWRLSWWVGGFVVLGYFHRTTKPPVKNTYTQIYNQSNLSRKIGITVNPAGTINGWVDSEGITHKIYVDDVAGWLTTQSQLPLIVTNQGDNLDPDIALKSQFIASMSPIEVFQVGNVIRTEVGQFNLTDPAILMERLLLLDLIYRNPSIWSNPDYWIDWTEPANPHLQKPESK